MKTYNKDSNLVKKMQKVFVERTNIHRLLVLNNLLMMKGYLDVPLDALLIAANQHDRSKLEDPERTAYTWMTWMYYCRKNNMPFTYPDTVEAIVFEGWQHHIHSNLHHPEAHCNPNLMNPLDIIEMVCDWTAIAQEENLNGGSCMQWATLNINKKWDFSSSNKKLIFATIKELDSRNQAVA